MELLIRPYAAADLESVTTIWLTSWESTGVMPPASITVAELRERFPREIAGGWEVHVGVVGREVVGFLALYGDMLEQLFIAPAHQGRGLGKRLLDFVKERRPGGFTLTTASESRAWRFYEREGLLRGPTLIHARFGFPKYQYAWQPRRV